jgi:hypothetical protein
VSLAQRVLDRLAPYWWVPGVAFVFVVVGLVATGNVHDYGRPTCGFSLLVAAKAGWGKSFKAQHVIEKNLPEYDRVLVLDFKDEYRGIVKEGLANWWIGGRHEREWSPETWHDFLRSQSKLVVARHDRMGTEEWRELCAAAIQGARRLGDVLVVIDEAHFVAPQKRKVPAAIEGLATTGRGEGASSVWITQRLSEAEETVLAQCDARLLGGFESDADLGKVGSIVEYPRDIHNPQVRGRIRNVADTLTPEGRETPMSVQKHEKNGSLRGSEWIYSNDSGERERRNTEGLAAEMASEHVGREGKDIAV